MKSFRFSSNSSSFEKTSTYIDGALDQLNTTEVEHVKQTNTTRKDIAPESRLRQKNASMEQTTSKRKSRLRSKGAFMLETKATSIFHENQPSNRQLQRYTINNLSAEKAMMHPQCGSDYDSNEYGDSEKSRRPLKSSHPSKRWLQKARRASKAIQEENDAARMEEEACARAIARWKRGDCSRIIIHESDSEEENDSSPNHPVGSKEGQIVRGRRANNTSTKARKDALRIQRLLLGGQDPDVAFMLNNVGNDHFRRGEYVEALQAYNDAVHVSGGYID